MTAANPMVFAGKNQARGMALGQLTFTNRSCCNWLRSTSRPAAGSSDAIHGWFFCPGTRNLDGQSPNERLARQWSSKVRVVWLPASLCCLRRLLRGVLEEVSEALTRTAGWSWITKMRPGCAKAVKVHAPWIGPKQGPRLYLVCRYEGFDNERSLALHRIRKAQASTLGFERPRNFDFQRYDDDGRFGFGKGERVRLTFEVERDAGFHLRETPLSHDQQVEDLADDWLRITATVVDSAMLHWWLRGFGAAVRAVQRDPIFA